MRTPLFLFASLLTFGLSASAATLSLIPNALYGLPGTTVGFGFTITSTPDLIHDGGQTPYLVITGAQFLPGLGYPFGIFTPFITQSFTVIGPPAGHGEVNPYSQRFNASEMTGLGSFAINPFASIGNQTITAEILLSYDEYSVSPNAAEFNPITDTLATGQPLQAPATVVVGTYVAPEPATAFLVMAGLAVAAMIRGKLDLRLRKAQSSHRIDLHGPFCRNVAGEQSNAK